MAGVEAAFGCHVDPALPAGSVGVRYGKFYAASDNFIVTVHGKSAHGAMREKGIDALAAAAEMVTALLALPQTLLPERSVVTVGKFTSGTVDNVIADRAEFRGILRTLGPDSRAVMKARLRQTLDAVAERTGTTVELTLRTSYSGIVNTDAETAHVQRTAEALLGPEKVSVIAEPLMISEDFGCYVDAAAGSFYHVGAGSPHPLHSPEFLPDDRAVTTAAAMHAAVLWTWLEQNTD